MRAFVYTSLVVLGVGACAQPRKRASVECGGLRSASEPSSTASESRGPQWQKPAPAVSHIRFETTKGVFVLELHRDFGPIGADRFYNLARLGYYDDGRFHRVNKNYIVQFGLNGDPAVNAAWKNQYLQDDPPRPDNQRGTFAFSMKGPGNPNTRNTQIYINLADNSKNNVEPFTALGTVVEGMSVVDSLYSGYGETSGPACGREGKARSSPAAMLTWIESSPCSTGLFV